MKAYKYRLYPTKAQSETLEWTLTRCCEVYNAALQERRDAWNMAKKHPNFYDPEWRKEHAKEYRINFAAQCRALTEVRNEIRPEYKEIGSHVLQNVLHRVENTFNAFFRRVKTGKTPGYPRFQSAKRYDSFCFPDLSGWKLDKNRLSITNLGTIKVKLHRPIEGAIKTTTMKREGTHWYVVFACEVATCPRLPYTDECVGIDLGVSKLATLSTGDVIENPRHSRKAEEKLACAQQALSRKKRGSTRRKKVVQRVGKLHRKVANQRKDSLHKQSRWLVDTYETIIFEDIKPANLSKRPKPKQDAETGQYLPNHASAKAGLNKSIFDAGWNMFIAFCTYKAASAGRLMGVVKVSPYKTSQRCSRCGKEGPHLDLSVRTFTCVHCGVVLDRDHNASLNIQQLWLGQSLQVDA